MFSSIRRNAHPRENPVSIVWHDENFMPTRQKFCRLAVSMRILGLTTFAVCALLSLSDALAGSYTVKPGDTAFSIAARFGIKADELLKRNKLSGPALHVGQVLDVPDQAIQAVAPATVKHTVATGETLFSIAKKYGSSVDTIKTLNKLGDAPLKVGQVLNVPVSSSSSSAVSSTPTPNASGSSSPVPSSTRPTIIIAPTPPPVPDVGTTNPSSSQTKPATAPQKPVLPSPAVVNGANVKPTVAAPVPPGPLPRSVILLPPPDPNNPFGEAKEQPISEGAVRTSIGAPAPDLGTPPNAPESSSTTPPDTATTPSGAVSSDPGTVGESPEILHSVARGDTLTSISKRYTVDVNAIRQANNLTSDAISIGQILKIPMPQLAPSTGPGASTDVRGTAERYLGVTYRYGGASNDGLDCSGFVVIVFNELGIKVPRTSAQQFAFGQPVERSDLQLGDLVFFNTTGQGVSHVGIYLSDNEFIHAASNPGRVIKSKLIEPYYAQRYLGARRVMTDE
jgi:cell wall-associated NlpC family hydrolase